MTLRTLVLRSLRFHFRSHLGVILGAGVGSAALIGALVVGDSVRLSLKGMALSRLGKVELALVANDRLFRDQLAGDLSARWENVTAPVLHLAGTAASSDGSSRANQVSILGVDDRFWGLANAPAVPGDGLALSVSLARQLNVGEGDTVLLRVEKPSLLSREAAVSPQEDSNVGWRSTVSAVVGDEQLGRYSLQANQVPPYNAFVPIRLLQSKVAAEGRANVLLVGGAGSAGGILSADQAQAGLREAWQLADSELELVAVTNLGGFDLRSRRVFIEQPVVEAARSVSAGASSILTYFVNELRVGERTTPYSMVAGVTESMVEGGLGEDEILLNDWLGEDLGAKAGDELKLTYYVVAAGQRLETAEASFRVRGTVPLAGVFADRNLTPEFPGVAKAESTREWDAGFPIDLNKVREKDEAYWTNYRGTPKAFVSLGAAQRLWGNRFGEVTSIRFPAAVPRLEIEAGLRRLDPAAVGLRFVGVRDQALSAAAPPVDFGQLFLGFSFFLIIAALVLMGLLFQLGLEQRATEIGTLLALGFPARRVRGVMLMEGLVLSLAGGLLGVAGGLVYARVMLHGLTTVWRDAVSTSALSFHVTAATLVMGVLASVVVSCVTVALVLRKQGRQPARQLLAQGGEATAPVRSVRGGRGLYVGIGAGIGGVGIGFWAMGQESMIQVQGFFGAGALLLLAGLGFSSALLGRLGSAVSGGRISIGSLGIRNCTRQRRRSLATIILLACGTFLVVAVGANKLDATRDAARRGSGTGGFALIGESALPVVHDLNGADGRDFFGLDEGEMREVSVVPFRVRDGDDASCLNLNKAQTPRLLGVSPGLLADREAFSFAGVWDGAGAVGDGAGNPWRLLEEELEGGVIPAIGDMNSIKWALQQRLGNTLELVNERGESFRVLLVAGLANSVLQGSLIISDRAFTRLYPGESGYRMFLVDAPAAAGEVSAGLSRALQDVGLELTPAVERLDAFNAVQNTYLQTFQILGGLGLLLGSVGLGVVVLRNVLERRSELALLRAVGFRRRRIHWLILSEHVGLLLLGLAVGILAAVAAVLPVLFAPGGEIHHLSLGATLIGVLVSGLIWTALATWVALRGHLLAALRAE